MTEDKPLVYIGKIIAIDTIPGADQIVSATVVCGQGGKWKGVVRKAELGLGDMCEVYLPDSLLPEDNERFAFMKASHFRVRMRRFKGAPSEVLIMPTDMDMDIGTDITPFRGVSKYHKPIPVHLQGKAKGDFPGFIPKTDELNYQRYGELVDALVGKPYYITEKCDGSSTTAFKYKGEFGLCSRNLELQKDANNGFWKVCDKYGIEEKLREGIALQWETCGPGIQSNPMGLKEIDGFAFSGYDISKQAYMSMYEVRAMCKELGFPFCKVIKEGESFSKEGIETMGEGKYSNGKEREGVVVRSQENFDSKPISFKGDKLGLRKMKWIDKHQPTYMHLNDMWQRETDDKLFWPDMEKKAWVADDGEAIQWTKKTKILRTKG